MRDLIPFQFEGTAVRVVTDENGEPWFVAKEIALALGYSDSEAMTRRLDDDEKQNLQIVGFGNRGVTTINESGLYTAILGSSKEEAKRFKRWVTHEVLPSLRKTGSYESAPQPAASSAVQPTKEFRALFGVARLVGMDKNAAALSANQAVAKLTGTNVLGLLGQTHLVAENQTALYFTPTELGERLGISGRKFNMLLAEAGLQAKKGDHWAPLVAAEGFCRIMDTGKRHGDGSMIQQIKWAENVLALVEKAA